MELSAQSNQLRPYITTLLSINLDQHIMFTTFPDGSGHPVLNICPHLQGANNWLFWNHRFRLMLHARDPQYWLILSGEYRRPRINHQSMTATEIMNIQIEQREWDNKSNIILTIMTARIDDSLSVYFHNRNAHQLYQVLKQSFQDGTHDIAFAKLESWLGYYYRSDMAPKSFLDLWRSRLSEVQSSYGSLQQLPQLPQILVRHIFFMAVGRNPACEAWVASMSARDRFPLENGLSTVYNSFLAFESHRLDIVYVKFDDQMQ